MSGRKCRTAPRSTWPVVPLRAAPALLDEADLAARLEHGPLDLVQRLDLLYPRLSGDLFNGQALAAQVRLDRLPVLHDDHGLALEDRAQPRQLEAEERREHLQQG